MTRQLQEAPRTAWRIQRLSQQHRQLDEQIAALEGRAYLSAAEQMLRQSLKKAKLAAKDALLSLQP